MNYFNKIEQNKSNLGAIGERIVSNYLTKQGGKVELSTNLYDRNKDLTVNNESVEVKTQVIWIKFNALTISPKQLSKCRSVNKLFFVTVPAPNPKHKSKYDGCIFSVDPKNFIYEEMETTTDKRKMLLIRINQKAVDFVEKVSNEDLKELKKYTTSAY